MAGYVQTDEPYASKVKRRKVRRSNETPEKLMFALLGRTDRHDVSAGPPSRVSRLTEAALIFLVAASGVFFVCAQPSAALGPLTMTVSEEEVIESYMHTTTVRARGFYVKVEWFINDDENPSKIQHGLELSSTFTRAYDGFGGPRGKPVKITAKVTDLHGNTASNSITFNAWSSSKSISILSKTSDSRIVRSNSLDLSIETDVGFWYVNWYVDGKYQRTDSGPALRSELTWTFSSGNRNGKVVKVEAVVYGINTNGPLPSDDDEITVTVFSGYGFLWRRMVSRVESFSKHPNHEYVFTSGHIIEYYYDGRPNDLTLRRKAGWYENGDPVDLLNFSKDKLFSAAPSFWESEPLPMDTPQILKPDKEYHVFAYTNFGEGNQAAEVESEKAFYDPDASDPLPIPTGKEEESLNPNLPDALK